jgi:hypothetical protein
MKLKTLTNTILSFSFAGAVLVGVAQAQDPIYPDVRDHKQDHVVKQETKREKALARNDRWANRQDSKMKKRLVKEGKFDTPATARGSEVRFLDTQGRYVSIGYIDKDNNFRAYEKPPINLSEAALYQLALPW